MMLHPAVVALLVGSLLVTGMLLAGGWFAIRVIRFWDLTSGSEEQLLLERQTYLTSTLVSWVFVIQLFSLFFFVATVDSLCPLVVGAMCAAGVLNADPYGYPALIFKLINFFAAGAWLILNRADNQGFDYPLIRVKYLLLLLIVPLTMAETILLWLFFARLKVNVITSCCGSLFSEKGSQLTAALSLLPFRPTMIAFWSVIGLTLAVGLCFLRFRRGGVLFGLLATAVVPVGLGAVIAGIAPYFYELPTHHCPFCILKREYYWVGYLLLGPLLVSGVTGSGVGMLQFFARVPSLARAVPSQQRRLALATILALTFLSLLVIWRMTFTDFRMG